MNKKIETKIESVKNFWNDHKGKLAVTATITTISMVALARASQRTNQEFLARHNLTEEFVLFLEETEED